MGLKTMLCEAGDFAWGTSSRSSKLIHGGLRYLKEGRIFLTYDAVKQRERLLREAPGMVEPLGFLMPVYKTRGPGALALQAGLTIYDFMAGESHHHHYDSEKFSKLVPGISTEGLSGGFRFMDAQVDDARLVLRLINEAVEEGGTALNYTRVARVNRNRERRCCRRRLGRHGNQPIPRDHHQGGHQRHRRLGGKTSPLSETPSASPPPSRQPPGVSPMVAAHQPGSNTHPPG